MLHFKGEGPGRESSPGRIVIIGGGLAGLSAAHALRSQGIRPVVFEARDRVGGRSFGDRVDGFFLDAGADFFCSSYDVAFRLCEELGVPLVRSKMKLGWYRDGRWATTTPGLSAANLIRNLPAAWSLGLLSPRAARALSKLVRDIRRQSERLNFSADCGIVELDGEEEFGDYLERLGAPESLKVALRGFLQMTMGHVERSGSAYMRAYLAEMLLKGDQISVPERGAGTLAHALAEACRDDVRVSTPVSNVVIRDGRVTGVVTQEGLVKADAVICAVPATRVPEIIPDLPAGIRHALGKVVYSSGCRVVIGLDRPPLPPGWHGALYPEDDTPLLLDRSINLPACVPPGKNTLDMLAGRERAEELLPLDDEEITRKMLSDARRTPPPGSALPDDEEGLFTRVYRWREAVCMGPPGMFKAMAGIRGQLRREVPNLFLAGDYLRVPSVNGALASGIGAAREAVGEDSQISRTAGSGAGGIA